jgi:inosine-uridine nucleoside N-ribohydrolase
VNCSKGEKDGETLASFFSPPGHSDQWEDGSELERKGGKKANAFVLEKLDVNGFFEVLLDVVERAEKVVGSTEM